MCGFLYFLSYCMWLASKRMGSPGMVTRSLFGLGLGVQGFLPYTITWNWLEIAHHRVICSFLRNHTFTPYLKTGSGIFFLRKIKTPFKTRYFYGGRFIKSQAFLLVVIYSRVSRGNQINLAVAPAFYFMTLLLLRLWLEKNIWILWMDSQSL